MTIGTLHSKSPGETLNRMLGLFPPQIRDARAWEMLSMLRFIVVQVLVRTADGKRRALREYIVFTDELRRLLQDIPAQKWPAYLDNILYQEKRRIVDKVRELYTTDVMDRSEAALYLPVKELNV